MFELVVFTVREKVSLRVCGHCVGVFLGFPRGQVAPREAVSSITAVAMAGRVFVAGRRMLTSVCLEQTGRSGDALFVLCKAPSHQSHRILILEFFYPLLKLSLLHSLGSQSLGSTTTTASRESSRSPRRRRSKPYT